jgi:hypothetical protein
MMDRWSQRNVGGGIQRVRKRAEVKGKASVHLIRIVSAELYFVPFSSKCSPPYSSPS